MNIHSETSGAYRLEVFPLRGEVVARNGNSILAASRSAKFMRETRLAPTIYFPLDDVAATLQASEKRTFCPFKGTATYWDVIVDDQIIADGAWTYRSALPESREIEGYVSFTQEALTHLDMGGNAVSPGQEGNISGPIVDWIMREAWLCTSPEELTAAIARKFVEDGIAVSRMSALIWSLHPMIAGKNYVWTSEENKVETYTPSHDLLTNPVYVNSPLRHVTNGLGGVRQNLQNDKVEFNFPILEELKAKGATDYVAMPLQFSNGQINVVTLTSNHPNGFTTANLGLIFECLSVISRLYEVFALRDNATALLETYLGRRTGERVLGGEIRRGDGDQIDAAILFCDLRGSSRLEEQLGREAYLVLLNRFFETTTAIINEHGGEVLKFIGDAVLAIFPMSEDRDVACGQALASALEIDRRLHDSESEKAGGNMDCAIGLAFGNVTYGNVGSKERLDFTVIGSAANVAARLGDLGKTLGHAIVATKEIAQSNQDVMQSLGAHELHNVSVAVEAWAPRVPVPTSVQ